MYCSKCGTNLDKSDIFCKKCGHKSKPEIVAKENNTIRNVKICYRCNKRKGSWWDHLCSYCRNMPISEKDAHDYEKTHGSRNVLDSKQISASTLESERKINKSAITGLILSIIAIFGIGLSGLIGIVLGIVALVQIKHTNEKGKSLAIAAIIIGFIWSVAISILKRLVDAGY